jgi:predicted helicase
MSLSQYLAELRATLARGDATEHSHRPALHKLLESLGGGSGIAATNEPRRIACGAPDLSVSRKKVPVGHVETKDIGVKLDEMEKGRGPHGAQFIRYRDGLPNWVLTDYLEFRWFVAGEKRLSARLAEVDGKGKLRALPGGEDEVARLLEGFLRQPALTVESARDLAKRMAGMTRMVRDLTTATLHGEEDESKRQLGNWLTSFREVLIPDLSEEQFADMFAQTLAYGLFAAKFHMLGSDKPFTREMAAHYLPRTNPFLRKLFAEIGGVAMPETLGWAVDDIVLLLNHADWGKVLKDFGKGKGKEDPVVHFYETFLAAYDPKMRELRGVYYTPEPVVSYIVRSVDKLLEMHFGKPKGLADEKTLILDPAVGTATFLYFVIQRIHKRFAGQKGAWDGYVAQHLLNRIFGFELLMAPYAVAHLKLGMQLQETGYQFASDQRLGIYLTNTLEEAARKSEKMFAQWISDEANAAAEIKRDRPILVVLGNPPYSNFGQMNRGKWILSLLEDYKRGLAEKKLNLDDDFIKFIRFAQWRIDKTGFGVLGYITNSTYLEGLTHRRMRESLLDSFNEVYVLNLHGNQMGKKRALQVKDENVFDITIGVSIGLFVKLPDQNNCRTFYAEIRGDRETKYSALVTSDIATTAWTELHPKSPDFLFVPREGKFGAEYAEFVPVNVVFENYNSALQTKKDAFTVHFTAAELNAVIADVRKLDIESLRRKYHLGPDGRDWTVASAKEDVMRHPGTLIPIQHKPFDLRVTYFTGRTKGFLAYPRSDVTAQLLNPNVALATVRQVEGVPDECEVLATRIAMTDRSMYSTHGTPYLFPLWLYEERAEGAGKQLRLSDAKQTRVPNLSGDFIASLLSRMGAEQVRPEEVFDYIYAVLHCSTYRTRYAEFLKRDFPRIPLTSDAKLFRALAEKGKELVSLHLMESPRLEKLITTFPVKGTNVVEKVAWAEEGGELRSPGQPRAAVPTQATADGRVWINPQQYFAGVPREVWEFHIGGYQVLEKWLKDRKGRKLTYDDIQHWQKVVVALAETRRVMQEIDGLIPGWPLP